MGCCEELEVDGVKYIFKENKDTSKYNCKDNCVYMNTVTNTGEYCFGSGSTKAVCRGNVIYKGILLLHPLKAGSTSGSGISGSGQQGSGSGSGQQGSNSGSGQQGSSSDSGNGYGIASGTASRSD